jgi:2-polyprenyl-3-methyl-5-hydroxy-6-metoxy-1,4-benzoquinol methylase
MSTTDLNEYSARIQFYTGEVPNLLSKCLDQQPWTSCIDIGCGDGAILHAMDARGLLENKSVYALDGSSERIKAVEQISENFVGIISDVCDTALEDGSIDVAISTQVIEHVEDDAEMVHEMHRIMKPKGMLYLTTIFKKSYGWYFYRCNGKWAIDPTHLREYSADGQLVDILTAAGFDVLVNKKSIESRSFVDAFMRRVGSRFGVGRRVYDSGILRHIRKIKIPIPGYYHWELVCQKR